MKQHRESFRPVVYVLFAAVTLAVVLLCVCLGSVSLPLKDTVLALVRGALGRPQDSGALAASIILPVRLPRVLCVAAVGAALSLCGAAMQGLLKNPLADGSTMGVSSGASLGAVIALAFGVAVPGLPFAGTTVLAVAFAFGSLLLILGVAYRLDSSLSTNTIILLGVIFSMFASSISSFIITFAGEKVKSIMFWTLGSLQGSSYQNAALLDIALVI